MLAEVTSKAIAWLAIFILATFSACIEQGKQSNVNEQPPRVLFPVEVEGKYGYMNKTGQIVIKPQFDGAADFTEGLARILIGDYETGNFGYIDTNGQIVISPHFKGAGSFSGGLASADDGKGPGVIDMTGKYIFNKTQGGKDLTDFVGFSEGLGKVTLDWKENHGPYDGFIDTTGKVIIPGKYHMAHNFSEGLASVREHTNKPSHWGMSGYIDHKDQWAITPQFFKANDFSEGLAGAFIDRDKCGYINKQGKWIIAPQYQECGDFSEGLASIAMLTQHGQQHGYIDKKGTIVIEVKYRAAWPFSGGLAQVETDGADGIPLFGYINNKGAYVWGPKQTSRYP